MWFTARNIEWARFFAVKSRRSKLLQGHGLQVERNNGHAIHFIRCFQWDRCQHFSVTIVSCYQKPCLQLTVASKYFLHSICAIQHIAHTKITVILYGRYTVQKILEFCKVLNNNLHLNQLLQWQLPLLDYIFGRWVTSVGCLQPISIGVLWLRPPRLFPHGSELNWIIQCCARKVGG